MPGRCLEESSPQTLATGYMVRLRCDRCGYQDVSGECGEVGLDTGLA